ncbi:MAG: hypothetical protein K6G85_02950 [Eubacterium sp.]|nr:hypothetical protein [Eubacterium sp.]
MGKIKRIGIIIMCILSELAILVQMWKVSYFTGTACLMKMIGWDKLNDPEIFRKAHILTAGLMGIEFVGMLVFTISFIRSNRKGRLKVAYGILLIHTALMAFVSMMFMRVWRFDNENGKLNIAIFFLSMLILGAVFVVFVLREQVGSRYGFIVSPVLLLVMVGLFSTNGLFGFSGISRTKGILAGLIVVLPYLTIFLFEKFVLEPAMKKYRY